MITIALHWWYLPLGLFLTAVLLMWRAEHEGGYFGGPWPRDGGDRIPRRGADVADHGAAQMIRIKKNDVFVAIVMAVLSPVIVASFVWYWIDIAWWFGSKLAELVDDIHRDGGGA